jgi:hypothetical protein
MSEVANSITEATAVVIVTKSKIILCGIKYIITSSSNEKVVIVLKTAIMLWNFVKNFLAIKGSTERLHKRPVAKTT